MDDGAVIISGNRIQKIGPWSEIRREAREKELDLGEAVLMPGLVNAHCHLELTGLAGRIPQSDSFTAWIQSVLRARQELDKSSLRESWLQGEIMLLRSGTTTVGNIESTLSLLPRIRPRATLRVCSFLEMTGVLSGMPPEQILEDCLKIIRAAAPDKGTYGLSPHAPYSTSLELLRTVAGHLKNHPAPVCMHIAESREEWEMFRFQRGELYDWLAGRRDMSDLTGQSPVQHAYRAGLLNENLIAVHANCLDKADIELLAKNRVSVAHCPRSHASFQHAPFRWPELKRAGINVCLGTDSLASPPLPGGDEAALNMFEEMRLFSKNHPECSSSEILAMATVHGARALRLEGKVGEFRPDAWADGIVIPFDGRAEAAEDHVVHYRDPIPQVMVDGEWGDTFSSESR